MARQYVAIILFAIVFFSLVLIPADSYIPPTRAFMRIFSGGENVTATSYNANLTLSTGGTVSIDIYNANNTIRFSTTTPSISMEGLSNVTDGGCAVGQARVVDGTGNYACSNIGTGDVTGAANVGAGTGTIFRDETAGTLNMKTLVQGTGITITNNANDITIASSASGGYTKINNLDGGTAKILATNASSQATVKTLTAGTGITITNGSKTITIDATASGGVTSLGSNVTLSTSASVDTVIWTIPLTANSGNTISGVVNAITATSGNAVRLAINITAPSNTNGYCKVAQISTATADALDNIVMNTVLTGRATNTGETAWIGGANVAMPITFDCALKSGASPGNLKIWGTQEVGGTASSVKAGSFYIKSP